MDQKGAPVKSTIALGECLCSVCCVLLIFDSRSLAVTLWRVQEILFFHKVTSLLEKCLSSSASEFAEPLKISFERLRKNLEKEGPKDPRLSRTNGTNLAPSICAACPYLVRLVCSRWIAK